MRKIPLLVLAVTAAVLVAAAAAPAPQGPQRMAIAYGDWLAPYVGKSFYLSADHTIATEKARTATVPQGAKECTLAGVGQDFVWFESRTERFCVPIVTLRAVLNK
jgi:hypothetical protein